MTYRGEMIDAEEAVRMRLVSRVVPHEDLLSTTLELAGRIAGGPPVQLSFAQMQMQMGLVANNLDISYAMEAWGLQSAARTEDYLEGHRAFYEKRDRQFRGY